MKYQARKSKACYEKHPVFITDLSVSGHFLWVVVAVVVVVMEVLVFKFYY